jgi:hypothetical protein
MRGFRVKNINIMKYLHKISNEITALEANRGNFTPEDAELLNVLNLCYDILSRTKKAQSMRIDDEEDVTFPPFFVFPIRSSQLADFAFALAAKQGRVDLKKLMKELKNFTYKELSEAGIRAATLNNYLKGKTVIGAEKYEEVLNFIISKTCCITCK